MKKKSKSTISYNAIKIFDNILSSHDGLTKQEIIEKFESYHLENNENKSISESYFYALIKLLKEKYQAPLNSIKIPRSNKKKYFYTDQSFSLPNVSFDKKQVSDLKKILNFIAKIKNESIHKTLETILPTLKNELEISLNDEPIIYFDENEGYVGRKFILPLFEKIAKKQVISIHYIKDGEHLTFEFHPYILKEYNNRWYLFGRNLDADQFLWNLALDRIHSFEDVNTPYKKCHVTDWTAYFNDFVGVTKENRDKVWVKLLVKASSKEYVISKPIHPKQLVEPIGKDIHVSFEVIPNYELESIILSFGENIEILEPVSLKEKLRKRLGRSETKKK